MGNRRQIWMTGLCTGLLALASVSVAAGAPSQAGPTGASIEGGTRALVLPRGEWFVLSGVGVLMLFAHRRHGLC